MKAMILTYPSRNRNPGKRAMTKLLVILSVALVSLHVVAAGVQDAENGGECVDSDPVNCPFWAATGECKANRGYMHRHCKKSCDRCKFVRVNDRAEMNRFIEQKRKEKEEQREIERKEKEVLKVLEGGVFDSGDNGNKNRQKELPPPKTETENTAATTTATTTISATGEVETTISATSGDLNQSNGDAVVSTANSDTVDIRTSNTDISLTAAATRTTGSSTTDEKPRRKKAKIDAETGLECVDMNENCPFLAATGDCKTNRGYMSVNCRLSCDRCHIVRVTDRNDIRKYIDQKRKDTEPERQAKREAREVRKILAGEL